MMAYIGVLITKSFPALIIQKATLFLQNAGRLHDNAARALPTLPQCNYKIHLLIALSGAAPKKNRVRPRSKSHSFAAGINAG